MIVGGLQGVFYDLKRLRNGNAASGSFIDRVREFTNNGWRPVVLNKFFRASLELYAPQFCIQDMNANEAPKHLGRENKVEPCEWIVIYSGQFSPPRSARFRFVGCGDDVLVVRVNGRVVLSGSWASSCKVSAWTPGPDGGLKFGFGKSEAPPQGDSAFGNWLDLPTGQKYQIEIVIRENPGGRRRLLPFHRGGRPHAHSGGKWVSGSSVVSHFGRWTFSFG